MDDIIAIKFKAKIHYEHIDPIISKGPCWARTDCRVFIKDEDYFFQIDSHTQFDKDWDEILIKYFKGYQLNIFFKTNYHCISKKF